MGPATLCREKPAVALAADDNGVLPLDVLFEVLLRLPTDVLCRLRIVCRSWQSLTSDPVFARAHALRHSLLVGVHCSLTGQEVRVVDMSGSVVKRVPVARPSYDLNTQFDMVSVSAVTFSRSPHYVLDLATGEEVVVVDDASLLHEDEHGGKAHVSPFLLGHVPSTGEMKVFYCRTTVVQACSITTLGDGSSNNGKRWRVTPSPPAHVASRSGDRVVIRGVVYFLLMYMCAENVEPDAIAVLDLVTEEWRPATIRGPLSSRLTVTGDDKKLLYHEYRYHIKLAEVDGCLVTLHNNHCQGSLSRDLWFLEDMDMDMDMDKGLWTKRYSIPFASHPYAFSSYPLRLSDDGKIMMWDEETQVLRAYDPRANEWADLATLRNYVFMNRYQGNLLCPGLRGEH